jgi:hypothetical protein
MKTPLTRRRRQSKKPQQLTFTFPTAAAAPLTSIPTTLDVGAADAQNASPRNSRGGAAAAGLNFEPGKPTRVVTRDCIDHLPNSQVFAAVATDPKPTGTGE